MAEMKPDSDNTSPKAAVWQERWFQWFLGVLVAAAALSIVVPFILSLLYTTRSVLVPVLIGLLLAYIVNPLVVLMQEKLRFSRLMATGTIVIFMLAVFLVCLFLFLPPLFQQGATLLENLKDVYPRVMVRLAEAIESRSEHHGEDGKLLTSEHMDNAHASDASGSSEQSVSAGEQEQASAAMHDLEKRLIETRIFSDEQFSEWFTRSAQWLESLNWSQVGSYVVSWLDIGVGVIGSAISFTTYVVVAMMVIGFCFFFFTWHFDAICRWFMPLIPKSRREQVLEVVHQMDASVSGFVRGRFIQVIVVASLLSIGWWICGVPYFLLLGVIGGLLNLVPYAPIFIWPVALLVAALDQLTGNHGGFDWLWALVLPSAVYLFVQTMDSYCVEPLVQGKATDLDPLTILISVLLGGAVAGLLGMLLAIPVAACIKIFSRMVLLPKLRAIAERY